jgi:endonuclease YncB( thermonuclease family)
MGNSISTITASIEQLFISKWISCCVSVPETEPNVKDKYTNYTDEIVASPNQSDLVQAYHSCTSENTPTYGYENLKKLVKVLKVMDGDTIDIALHYETGKIFKHRIRLFGIDTPEMHPSLSNPDRLKEIEASKQAKEALTQRLHENDNLVIAHFHTFDKYGRLMATLYDKTGEDINKWMIASGHAQEYFGKTKKKFVASAPLILSASENDYFETPRPSDDDFEEFPTDITEEAKNSISS